MQKTVEKWFSVWTEKGQKFWWPASWVIVIFETHCTGVNLTKFWLSFQWPGRRDSCAYLMSLRLMFTPHGKKVLLIWRTFAWLGRNHCPTRLKDFERMAGKRRLHGECEPKDYPRIQDPSLVQPKNDNNNISEKNICDFISVKGKSRFSRFEIDDDFLRNDPS